MGPVRRLQHPAAPPPARYETPSTLEDALERLGRYGARARIVAGATDLLLERERGAGSAADVLVDVTRIPGLAGIRPEPDGTIHIGPLVTHAQAVHSDAIVRRLLPLAQACLDVGTPALRNRATLAGNVVTASPAADARCALVALGAHAVLRSVRGTRTCAVADVRGTTGAGDASIRPDELLVDIAVPALRPEQRGIFAKLRMRQGQAIAIVNGAIVVALDEDGRVGSATIALGSVGPDVLRARSAEDRLTGARLDGDSIAEVAERAAREARPIDDVHAGAAYRRSMTQVLVRRALSSLARGSERSAWPDRPPALWGRVPDGRSPTGGAYEASHGPESAIEATVNGRPVSASAGQSRTLLQWLREEVRLVGTKDGCGEGVCGACTVQLDGLAVLACLVPAARAHRARIVTIEGLAPDAVPHALQKAFVECGAIQCGFCTPGFLMAGATLLRENPTPSPAQVRAAYAGNLCRCTGYRAIERAVRRVADHPGSMQPRDDRDL